MKIFRKSHDNFIGSLTGISGVYEGAIFRIDAGENITIGRDPKVSQIVVDENCELVSRRHCTVRGNAAERNYSVTDHSTNGTFINGNRLPKDEEISVPKGTVITLGDDTNAFKLN